MLSSRMEDTAKVIGGMSNSVRRRRSQRSRGPRLNTQTCQEAHDTSSLSSDEGGKGFSDGNDDGVGNCSSRKEMNLNQCVSRLPTESEKPRKRSRKEDVRLDVLFANIDSQDGHKRSSEGVLAPANWKSSSSMKEGFESESSAMDTRHELGRDGIENKTKVKKVTLKVAGVRHTIDTNSAGTTSSSSSGTPVPQLKCTLKGNPVDDCSLGGKTGCGLQGIPWKDFSKVGFSLWKEDSSIGKLPSKNQSGKQEDPVCNSRRAPKKHLMNGAFDVEDDDNEIRFLEKLKNSKLASGHKYDYEPDKRHKKLSKISQIRGDRKRKSPHGETNHEEEEAINGNTDAKAKKKVRKEPVGSAVEPIREMTLMTRRRALQSGKDPSAGLVEFPNGLPSPPRKKKETLTEVEQQLKKAEAAKRRRLQNEKAERESQEEAIRKILGQDSGRLTREEKKKKRQEELAKEKAAEALRRAANSIRLDMGPNGSTVTFPNEIGLPEIFNSKPNGYPPPRGICAGPSCSNPYKYRDSKTMLPLCSLQCYKLVQGNFQSDEGFTGDTNSIKNDLKVAEF
ncbi:hypothetical protein Drorol1_Dr00022274 [Drosera rotundifolia]